jgi:S1-C subfamily serine protease
MSVAKRWRRSLARAGRILAGTFAVALLCALPWASVLAATGPSGMPRQVTPRGPLGAEEKATIALFQRSRASVVYITTRAQVQDFWTRNVFSVPRGTGSGFVWDEYGDIVTNYHVIEDASEATVRLADGRDYKASLVGVSRSHDIAVLRIKTGKKRLQPLPLGSSRDLRVGQKVFAIGNPFGLDWTLTSGIISALNRSLADQAGGATIEHLIQTDAAINPGNSGGPLLDSAGRLIGINTAIYSPSGANAGIGFAVPVDMVNKVVPELIRHGKYVGPSLGIEVDDDLNRRLTQILGVKGIAILRVKPGGPADKAGLKGVTVTDNGDVIAGDIITAVNGKRVHNVGQFAAMLDDFKIGERVKLTVLRNGKRVDVAATLQAER